MEKITELIDISRYYGQRADYVIAGGGNTSYKNDKEIWIKASGIALKNIDEEGFAVLNRERLQEIYTKQYSTDPEKRENEVKNDLYKARNEGVTLRPSVETSLHELIRYSFVVHTHPTIINGVTCSNHAEKTISSLFGDKALFVPYTDPGYLLFIRIKDLLLEWRKKHNSDPQIIFLQNHGVFVSADTSAEIKSIYEMIESGIKKQIKKLPQSLPVDIPVNFAKILPAIRMLFSADSIKIATIRNNTLINLVISDATGFSAVSLPFTPDQIVYCKARPLYLEQNSPENIVEECRRKTSEYEKRYGYMPKIIALKGYGIIGIEEDARSAETILDVFEDWIQISLLSENFGGHHFMSDREISFIDNWEVENYRRKVLKSAVQRGKIENKIVVVTGGAQGIGKGIAESMALEGANVVISDLNEEKGNEIVSELNRNERKNRAVFVKTNVADAGSVENLMTETVRNFGGIDVFISNAGILHAGSLEEMLPQTFEKMTAINYNAYFLCTKYVSEIMKLQSKFKDNYFTDIIQINSKSGLKGSNKNFAYAGSKFGGIGLTQSFALELIPYRIKVNAICPGNFFDGPLWSDPETGLFVQYLKTGKVPGAKTIDEVKIHYERQVPAGRGCRINDLMKAIFYVIDQEYETGQAVPVTGGQEMLK